MNYVNVKEASTNGKYVFRKCETNKIMYIRIKRQTLIITNTIVRQAEVRAGGILSI